MTYLGTLADYDFYICKQKGKETSSLLGEIDFSEANGITDFDSRKVLILESTDVREKLASLCHEIIHVYMEKWGFHDMYSTKQREFMAQFFGGVIVDVALHNKNEFERICRGIQEFKVEGGSENDGASRIEKISEE